MVITKSPREIELMRVAGSCLADIFSLLEKTIKPGMSTKDIDDIVEREMIKHDCIPAEKGYYGYPASSCCSVNEVLVHGIPSSKKILKDGDIVSVDIVATYKGYSSDACRTFLVGTVLEKTRRIVEVTKEAFFEGVKHVAPGKKLGDVSSAIQKYVESHGYTVTRDYTGHGIGKSMHEDPYIPNYGNPNTGIVLQKGMTLAIEPMVLEGRPEVRVLKDGWTAVSKDGKLTAHYENTVVVTDQGYEIITMYEGEQ